jgi:hypothetical protein
VAPTPDHPDALSKKTKKRFPTLELADGATLRWDSYVNIRHVYKIKRDELRPYTNPETPNTEVYRFERESMVRMLAKGKTLTMYEAGPQYIESLERSNSVPFLSSARTAQENTETQLMSRSPSSDATVVTSTESPSNTGSGAVDFRVLSAASERVPDPQPKVPPDSGSTTTVTTTLRGGISRPLIWGFKGLNTARSVVTYDQVALVRFWRDSKGVIAVVIAST